MKWSCVRFTTDIFSGSRCIRVCETNHRCLIVSFLLNLGENITFLKNVGVGPKNFMVLLLEWSFLNFSRNIFSGSQWLRCLKRATRISERVAFAEFEWKYRCFWNIKKGEWDLKILFFNYWNDFTLGSIETYFLQVVAYVFLKRTTECVW